MNLQPLQSRRQPRFSWFGGCLAAIVVLLIAPGRLWAHDPGLSTVTVRLESGQISVAFAFSVSDAAQLLESDPSHAAANVAATVAALQKIAPQALEISLDGTVVPASSSRCQFDGKQDAIIDLTYSSRPFSRFELRSKWLTRLRAGHRQFLTVQDSAGKVLTERLLSANADTVTLEATPSSGETETGSHSFVDFLVMGVKHIWTGYDHLLFLFGLLVVTRNFAGAVKIITCFTIAHSITLAVATLSLVQISSRVVEPLIAASIVYVGIENLLRGDDPKGRWLLTLAFGLIHGFGFASVLKDLGVGANGSSIAVPLISFNLGVELGQIAIAGAALPLIWKLRSRPDFVKTWVPACSAVVALLGTYWFVQRVWG